MVENTGHVPSEAEEIPESEELCDIEHDWRVFWEGDGVVGYQCNRCGKPRPVPEIASDLLRYREALVKIASCESRIAGDVVDIAKKALNG